MTMDTKQLKGHTFSSVLDLTQDSDSERELEQPLSHVANQKTKPKSVTALTGQSKKKNKDATLHKVQSLKVSLEKLPSTVSPLKTYRVSIETDLESTEVLVSSHKSAVSSNRIADGKAKEKLLTEAQKTAGKLRNVNKIFEVDVLDQTADFSSGFTPFKSVAAKVVKKNKLAKKSVRQKGKSKQQGNKPQGAGPPKTVRIGPRLLRKAPEKKAASSASNEADIKIVATSEKTVATVQTAGNDSNDSPSEAEGDLEPSVQDSPSLSTLDSSCIRCQICGQAIAQDEKAQHIKLCLQKNYQRTKRRGLASDEGKQQTGL